MSLRDLAYLLLAGAALSGGLYARRERTHWSVAAFLVANLVASLLRTVLAPLIVTDGPPLMGWRRALFHVEEALFLLGPIGMLSVAFIVLGAWPYRRSLKVFGGGWANVVGVAAVGYPFLRGETLRTFYLAVEIASLLLSLVAVFSWLRRRVPASPTVLCVLLAVGIEFTVMLLGPWTRGLFGAEAWAFAQAGYCALYMILIFIQSGALWIRS